MVGPGPPRVSRVQCDLRNKNVRIVECASMLTGVTVGITTLFCLVRVEPGPLARQKQQKNSVVIERRSIIPEQHPTASDLRQDDGVAPNHSLSIDSAIKRTLRDPDSYRFISATSWAQDFASYGPKAWICQAEYRSRNALDAYGLPEEVDIIFDAEGCRVLHPRFEKKLDALAASEHKTLMYAIKRIYDPYNNAH
jgi:hypothetical protein